MLDDELSILTKRYGDFFAKNGNSGFPKNAVPPHVDHHADPTEHFKQVSTSSNFDTFMLTIEMLPS